MRSLPPVLRRATAGPLLAGLLVAGPLVAGLLVAGLLVAGLAGLGSVALVGPAWAGTQPVPVGAGEAGIAYVEDSPEGLRILLDVPAGVDLDLVDPQVSIAGQQASASAETVDDAIPVRRTTVLVIDTSNSMRGARFTAARTAAQAFVRSVPDDVYVGVVGFDDDVAVLLDPTQDRAEARDVIESLSLSAGTSLYDAVVTGAEIVGAEGQRNLLVLSDGADTSDTPLAVALAAIDQDLIVDTVALDQGGVGVPGLAELAEAGDGQVVPADPAALRAAFAAQAQSLAEQVLVTATVPAAVREAGTTEAELVVTLGRADGTGDVVAESYSPLTAQDAPVAAPAPARAAPMLLPTWAAYAGPAVLGVGLILLLVLLVPAPARALTVEERVTRYTTLGNQGGADDRPRVDADQALSQAKDAAAGLLRRSGGLEARISTRLEAAGSELRSAEWLLVHGGIFVVTGLLGLLLGQGDLIVGILFLLVGAGGPWLWLGLRTKRRRKAFSRALPDTLQLMSGSLSAGLSLAQSVDTIVREGVDPIAGEFKRVLIEARLGVSLEDALDGVSERFESRDFEWVVMAIRIQRQVGGNLAELLDSVAETMRERDYMRRQVAALAAEGKLSAYVLGGLPPLFLVYLLLTNRDYVSVLFTEPIGWAMLAGAAVLLAVGGFWMSRLIKVEI